MNPTTWALVGKIVDGNKRPLFPSLAPQNALGTSDLTGPGGFYGLPVVLDAGIPANFIYLCIREGLEFYSSPSGDQPFTLSVDEPNLLGVMTAIYSYASTYGKPGAMAVVKTAA
jgi:hypothetical protein